MPKILSHKLKNRDFGDEWRNTTLDRWNYEDFRHDPRWRQDWISFDCLCYVSSTDTIYAGITSFDADIFWGWNRKQRQWVSTGYERVADPFDAKFHRSLLYHADHLWAACALLHDVDKYFDAPGSPLIKYHPLTGAISRLPAPAPHHYIQSLCLDPHRNLLYAQTFTPEKLLACDLATGSSRELALTGSGMDMGQGENIILDDHGCVWGGWSLTRAWQSSPGPDKFRLFRYCPVKDQTEFFKTGLPNPDGSYGYAKVEGLFNFHTGCLYASAANGSLYRIDPDTGRAEYLHTPISDRPSRLASLALAPDGCAYGVTGRQGRCRLLRFDPQTEKSELLDPIIDNDGLSCWQVHDVQFTPDFTLYAGENDNPHRSSFLWEIQLNP